MERSNCMFHPKLVTCLKSYDRTQFVSDLLAGMVVGVVALPLALAFAIASGVPPERGLYTAIVAGFLISALGGSRVQIGGPTGAFVVLVFDIVHRHGIDGLALCTFMAGGIVLLMGLIKLGTIIKYIPHPVVTGFTAGIAVIIFSTQIKDLLGLQTSELPGDVAGKWAVYLGSLDTITWPAVALSALCIAIILLTRRLAPRLPGTLLAMIVATILVQAFALPVETIGSRFGAIPATLPAPQLPDWSLERARELISPALTVALLAAIESLLSAMVADTMIGGQHRPNTELIAQGIANLASPLFGGIPATGAIARTATNVKNGARTPVAGMVHALTLLLIMLFFSQWASLVPMCALAAILVIVAWNMSEWHTIKHLLHAPRSDVAVLLATFFLTVVFDLTVAVQVGVVLSAVLFVRRMAELTRVGTPGSLRQLQTEMSEDELDRDPTAHQRQVPDGVEVYEIHGPFFFGAADKLRGLLSVVSRPPRVMILRLRHVPVIDATGLHELSQFHSQCRRKGTHLILSGVQGHMEKVLLRWPASHDIGHENIVPNFAIALRRTHQVLGLPEPVHDAASAGGSRIMK